MQSETAQPSARFLDALKRLNAKERNFLMRYALCGRAAPALSQDFVNDLRRHLKQIGVAGADDAQAVYFGMDYHLEWIHAALLYAQDSEPKRYRITQENARIEDVDLLVVLQRADHHLLLVLIEAKGVSSFSRSQFDSKLARLKHLREAMQSPSAWITPVMLLMSPKEPADKTCASFASSLHKVGFWPDRTRHQLLWMELKGFFGDLEGEGKAWSIRTCYEDGGIAASLAERDARRYDHWRIAERFSEPVGGEKRKRGPKRGKSALPTEETLPDGSTSHPSPNPAPTARYKPAQGNALGNRRPRVPEP